MSKVSETALAKNHQAKMWLKAKVKVSNKAASDQTLAKLA